MSKVIEIYLKNYRCFNQDIPVKIVLEPGKTVAITGANNVGKSALLRFFYEMKSPLVEHQSGSWKSTIGGYISDAKDPNLNQIGNRYGLIDILNIYPNCDAERAAEFGFSCEMYCCNFKIAMMQKGGHSLKKEREGVQLEVEVLQEIDIQFRNTLYIGAHRNLLSEGTGTPNYYDLSVGSAFTLQWSYLKNGTDTANSRIALKAERLITELLGWNSLSIDASDDKSQLHLTKNGLTRFTLAELGSGISELIVSIVTAAIKKPSWILIDEPESHLHPAMQIKFIEALEGLASHGVVFTTHSIGLARTCADSILVMQQDKRGRSYLKPFENVGNFSQLMGELAFSQMHELGCSALLLCEGVTEIKTLRQILRKWKLDASVMLIPLGGDALIDPNRQDELNEFNRFNAKVFVIIDSERKHENDQIPKRDKFIKECGDLFGKNSAIQTKLRAIENYFTEEAIRNGLRSHEYAALGPFDELKSSPKAWGKNNNHKIAAEMSKEDWLNTDIGEFFEFISVQINSMKS